MKVLHPTINRAHYFLFGIMILALVLYIIGYNFSVPILSEDEGWMLGLTMEARGLADVEDLPGYPPMILIVFNAVTSFVELRYEDNPLLHTAEIIILIRLVHVVVNLLSLFFIYGAVGRLSNPWAGLLAAAIWAIAPGVFEHIRLALSEAWLLMFISGSIYFMMETLERKRAWLAIASTLFGLCAIATKYNVAPVLSFGLMTVLLLAWKDNKGWLKVFGLQILLILLWAYLLLFGYGANQMIQSDRPTASTFLESGLEQLTDPRLILRVFLEAAEVLTIPPYLALFLLGFGGVIYLYRANLYQRMAWLLILAFAIFTTWLVAAYLLRSIITDRYVAAASSAWLILLVTSAAAIFQAFPRGLFVPQAGLALLLLGYWIVPMIQNRVSSVEGFLTTDTRVTLSEWSSASLPAGTIALDGQHWFIFDPVWGGYHGTLRPWVARELWAERPVEDWMNADVRFVQLSGEYPGDRSVLPFTNLYLLKSIPVPEEESRRSGDSFHIYRVTSESFVDVNIGFENGIELAAYELSGRYFSAGETLVWLPYWQASQKPEVDYQVFLHLVPLDSFNPVAQLDLSPALPSRPSSSWDDPYETIMGNSFQLTIPAELEAGWYRLIAGLYRLDNFERLRTTEGRDYVEITEINVRN